MHNTRTQIKKGDFVLKKQFKTLVLKISGIQKKLLKNYLKSIEG